MDGIHDMGGMHGFGRIPRDEHTAGQRPEWEEHVQAMIYQYVGRGWANVDMFRHAIERLAPATYLTVGYFGRWLRALELLAVEAGILTPGAVDARMAGRPVTGADPPPPPSGERPAIIQTVARAPRFAPGARVRARNLHPSGHTRLPGYVRGHTGIVERVRAACIYPDSHAHGRGIDPQHVYSVRFTGAELWGADAEAGTSVTLDLFEPYLDAS